MADRKRTVDLPKSINVPKQVFWYLWLGVSTSRVCVCVKKPTQWFTDLQEHSYHSHVVDAMRNSSKHDSP